MNSTGSFERTRSAIVYAHSSCLCLGLALIALGLAPAVIERIVTHQAPDMIVFLAGAASICVGSLFVALHTFIRRGARWAAWAGFLTAMLLLLGWFAASRMMTQQMLLLVVPVLAGATTIATWIALKFGWRPAEGAEQASHEAAPANEEVGTPAVHV